MDSLVTVSFNLVCKDEAQFRSLMNTLSLTFKQPLFTYNDQRKLCHQRGIHIVDASQQEFFLHHNRNGYHYYNNRLLIDNKDMSLNRAFKNIADGWRGVISIDDDYQVINKAVNTVLDGGLWYPRKVLDGFILHTLEGHPNGDLVRYFSAKCSLTSKERVVMKHLLSGFTNKQIASKMYISLNTVKTHIKNIMDKTNCHSRYALISMLTEED